MRRVCIVWVTAALLLPTSAQAQTMVPWFDGLGVSAGGGPLRFEGDDNDPLTGLIRPEDDTLGAGAFGFLLSAGTRRWALIVPELHAFPASVSAEGGTGTLTLGARSLAFVPELQSVSAYAVLFGVQASPLASGRLWARGGVGAGWISRHIGAEDQAIAIDLSTSGDTGLALSGAAGVSVWSRRLGERAVTSIDAEFHYVAVRSGGLRATAPSIRVGWRIFRQDP